MNYFFKTNDFNLEHNDFDIECIPKFTKKEHDLFIFLLKNYNDKEEYSGIDKNSIKINQEEIKKNVLGLIKKIVHCYVYENNKNMIELYFNLFEFIIIEEEQIIYKFSNEIRNSRKLGNFYTRINLQGILKFKYSYTKDIYKIISKRNNKKDFIEYSLDEFKNILKIKEPNYNRYYNLENKVLNPIVKDIESADVILWFEKIKNSSAKTSRVTGVKMHYINGPISKIHKETNEIMRMYNNDIKDYARTYELIYNYKKFNTFEDTLKYIDKNHEDIFKED